MKHDDYWKRKLTAFDLALCKMVESLTEKPCVPKNGGTHFFFEADYEKHNNPQYILAIWDAIEGRTGKRLISMKDSPDRHSIFVRVNFCSDGCPEAAFVPKIEQE